MASETPRTDVEEYFEEGDGGGNYCVNPEFSRQLERELSECRKQLDAAREVISEIANWNGYGESVGCDAVELCQKYLDECEKEKKG